MLVLFTIACCLWLVILVINVARSLSTANRRATRRWTAMERRERQAKKWAAPSTTPRSLAAQQN
jgi:hypothetical protein